MEERRKGYAVPSCRLLIAVAAGIINKKPTLEQAEAHLRRSMTVLREILKTYGLPEE